MKYFVKAKLSENISETPEGYLVCIGVPIARTGEQVYGKDETPLDSGSNNTVTIMREESEVFRPETLASFEGKSVTITHPVEFVNPKNWKQLTVGTIQNIRRGEGDFSDSLLADVIITDDMAINLVKNGLREVSCGYEADYEQDEPGYGYQRNIVGNHLALVDQGRAGSSYAINDHKGTKMTLKERFKKLRAKFADAEKEMKDAMEEMGDEGELSRQDPASGKPAMAKDADEMYDELMSAVTDLGKMVKDLSKAKAGDEDEEEGKKEKEEPKKKAAADDDDDVEDDDDDKDKSESGDDDDDEDGEADMASRLKKLEAAVAKLLEARAGDEEKEVGDEDEEESEDDDFDESTMVGDAAMSDVASRAEILAPGIEITKNVKVKALKAAYATKDGRQIIKSLSGGKEPAWDKKDKIETLFTAASEVMKATRVRDNANTKRVRDNAGEPTKAFKTAEDINAINAKHFGLNH